MKDLLLDLAIVLIGIVSCGLIWLLARPTRRIPRWMREGRP